MAIKAPLLELPSEPELLSPNYTERTDSVYDRDSDEFMAPQLLRNQSNLSQKEFEQHEENPLRASFHRQMSMSQ
jgi:hypothetical protein